MDDLSVVEDNKLLINLKNLVEKERRVTALILAHLDEVQRRRLYAQEGCGSLFDYCVRVLKYTEGAAARRISAMKLIRTVPETEKAIEEGRLSLTNAAMVQNFLNREKKEQGREYLKDEKLSLLSQIESKTSRECEKILAGISPKSVRREMEWAINSNEYEVRFVVSTEFMQKIQQVKTLISHKVINPGYAELFEYLTEQFLLRNNLTNETVKRAAVNSEGRYIPQSLRRLVWQRDGGTCQYISANSGRKCESRFQLEVDHIVPVSQGGNTSPENLRLLCRQHNAWSAIEILGKKVMKKYLRE